MQLHQRRIVQIVFSVLTVVLPGLCVADQLHAQALSSKQQNDMNVNWKNHVEAGNILKDRISLINQQLPGLIPGTPSYTQAVRRICYYKEIVRTLDEGVILPIAMEQALPYAGTLGGEREVNFTSGAELRALYVETRSFLTN